MATTAKKTTAAAKKSAATAKKATTTVKKTTTAAKKTTTAAKKTVVTKPVAASKIGGEISVNGNKIMKTLQKEFFSYSS